MSVGAETPSISPATRPPHQERTSAIPTATLDVQATARSSAEQAISLICIGMISKKLTLILGREDQSL